MNTLTQVMSITGWLSTKEIRKVFVLARLGYLPVTIAGLIRPSS